MSEREAVVEDVLVEEVVKAIKAYDPFAIIRSSADTYEDEDLYVYVYTDRDSVELLRSVAEVTVRLSEEEDFHVVILPMRKDEIEGERLVEQHDQPVGSRM